MILDFPSGKAPAVMAEFNSHRHSAENVSITELSSGLTKV
jgi:hypothetical protein